MLLFYGPTQRYVLPAAPYKYVLFYTVNKKKKIILLSMLQLVSKNKLFYISFSFRNEGKFYVLLIDTSTC